jgi:hypothetical protein
MKDTRNIYKILAGKREGKRPLEISMLRFEDNIKMNLKDM